MKIVTVTVNTEESARNMATTLAMHGYWVCVEKIDTIPHKWNVKIKVGDGSIQDVPTQK